MAIGEISNARLIVYGLGAATGVGYLIWPISDHGDAVLGAVVALPLMLLGLAILRRGSAPASAFFVGLLLATFAVVPMLITGQMPRRSGDPASAAPGALGMTAWGVGMGVGGALIGWWAYERARRRSR
jgi:hypothetical protein